MASRSPGERAGLSRDMVLMAALDLVDQGGLGQLTMRRLGAVLGVEAMTLYNYVPSKDALVDGMIEFVFAASAPALLGDKPWDLALRGYAEALRASLLQHPGILPVVLAHPASTPHMMEQGERALRLLCDAGFSLGRALDVINSVSVFVIGHAVAEVATPSTKASSDPGSTSALASLDATRYPLLRNAARSKQGVDDHQRFTFALNALVAGFSATLNVGKAFPRKAPKRKNS